MFAAWSNLLHILGGSKKPAQIAFITAWVSSCPLKVWLLITIEGNKFEPYFPQYTRSLSIKVLLVEAFDHYDLSLVEKLFATHSFVLSQSIPTLSWPSIEQSSFTTPEHS